MSLELFFFISLFSSGIEIGTWKFLLQSSNNWKRNFFLMNLSLKLESALFHKLGYFFKSSTKECMILNITFINAEIKILTSFRMVFVDRVNYEFPALEDLKKKKSFHFAVVYDRIQYKIFIVII